MAAISDNKQVYADKVITVRDEFEGVSFAFEYTTTIKNAGRISQAAETVVQKMLTGFGLTDLAEFKREFPQVKIIQVKGV